MLLFLLRMWSSFFPLILSAEVDNGMSTALHVGGWGVEL